MSDLYLFAHIDGTAVAIRTDEVEAVVRIRELSPVPGAPGHVAGLFALRSRVLTIIDAAALVLGSATTAGSARDDGGNDDGRYAIVCQISGHSYGILVDRVDDIQRIDATPLPVCGRIDEAWQPYADAVVEYEGRPHFILAMTQFLEGCLSVQAA